MKDSLLTFNVGFISPSNGSPHILVPPFPLPVGSPVWTIKFLMFLFQRGQTVMGKWMVWFFVIISWFFSLVFWIDLQGGICEGHTDERHYCHIHQQHIILRNSIHMIDRWISAFTYCRSERICLTDPTTQPWSGSCWAWNSESGRRILQYVFTSAVLGTVSQNISAYKWGLNIELYE